MSKVEEVAKAIFEAWAKEEGSDATWSEVCEMVGQDGYVNAKKWHRMAFAEARAAIRAMRGPTKAMKEAGFDAVLGSVDALPCGPIEIQSDAGSYTWHAMIDEALREDAQ